jgi:hypothetical protein
MHRTGASSDVAKKTLANNNFIIDTAAAAISKKKT